MRHTATISAELIGSDGWSEILADVSFNVSSGWYADRDEKRIEDMKVDRLYRIETRKRFDVTETITHVLSCPDWLEEMICDHADMGALLSDIEDDAYGDACDDAYDRRREAAE